MSIYKVFADASARMECYVNDNGTASIAIYSKEGSRFDDDAKIIALDFEEVEELVNDLRLVMHEMLEDNG